MSRGRKALDLRGQVFGKLTVVEFAGRDARNQILWKTICACGRNSEKSTAVLRRRPESCSVRCSARTDSRRVLDLMGQQYGRLTVLAAAGIDSGGHRLWVVTCACTPGSRKEVAGSSLNSGRVNSCGCLQVESMRDLRRSGKLQRKFKLEPLEAAIRKFYGSYRGKSRKEDEREFALSLDEFRQLIMAPCFYCGAPPRKYRNGGKASIIRNGIDRVRNEIGYVAGNCVTCCEACNKGKHTMSYVEWITHIDHLVNYQNSIRQLLSLEGEPPSAAISPQSVVPPSRRAE